MLFLKDAVNIVVCQLFEDGSVDARRIALVEVTGWEVALNGWVRPVSKATVVAHRPREHHYGLGGSTVSGDYRNDSDIAQISFRRG